MYCTLMSILELKLVTGIPFSLRSSLLENDNLYKFAWYSPNMNIFQKKRLFLHCMLFLMSIVCYSLSFSLVGAQSNYSTDAIAVYTIETIENTGPTGDVYYSLYGHNPAIPKPVDASLIWRWWTFDGENMQTARIPNPIVGDDEKPSIAFSREGFAMAVWGTRRFVRMRDCGSPPSPVFVERGDILFSVWNETGWSPAAVAVAGTEDVFLSDPSIAIDSNGNGIVLYTRNVYLRSSEGCLVYPQTLSVEYARFNGSDKTFTLGDVVLDPPFVEPFTGFTHGPEVAFTSKLMPDGSFTRHEAIAAWWSEGGIASKICGPGDTIAIPTFWPKKAIWNGNVFIDIDYIPDKLEPPPDLTDRLSVLATHKIGISADDSGNAQVVWGIRRQFGEPCTGSTANAEEMWHARWNVSEWNTKARRFDTLNGFSFPFGVDVAYLPDNNALAVYQDNRPLTTEWASLSDALFTPRGSLDAGVGRSPTVASLAHNLTIAIFVEGRSIAWSGTYTANSWSTAQELFTLPGTTGGIGEQPDIAAHTGSPTLPHAEWTYLFYQAGDSAILPISGGDIRQQVRDDKKEIKGVGSTNLVNFVTHIDPGDDREQTSQRLYLKKDGEKVLGEFIDTNMGKQKTLSDSLAFFLEAYPSRRTIVDFDGHGLGYPGVCGDYRSGDDYLNLTELENAYKEINKKFNIMSFDACLMAMLEVFYQLKNHTNYFVASQEAVYDSGFNYFALARNITQNPKIRDQNLSAVYVDLFKNYYEGDYGWGRRDRKDTISAVDASKINDLKTSVDNLSNALLRHPIGSVDRDATIAARKLTEKFEAQEYKDLYRFAEYLSPDSPLVSPRITDAATLSAASDVMRKVNESVIKEWHDSGGAKSHFNAHGISIYLEDHNASLDSDYKLTKFAQDTKWDEVVERYATTRVVTLKLQSDSPYLFLDAVFNEQIIGGLARSESRCGTFCTMVDGTSCRKTMNGMNLLIEGAPPLTWHINGSLLSNITYYNLTIRVTDEDAMLYEEFFTGTIGPDQFITGQFTPEPPINESEAPLIVLLNPENNSVVNDTNSIVFSYRAEDTNSSIASCSLVLNGNTTQTDTTIMENNTQSFTQFLTNGNYNWQVFCIDNSTNANQGSSETRNVIVNVPILPVNTLSCYYNSSGSQFCIDMLWNKTSGTSGNDISWDVEFDSSGNIVVGSTSYTTGKSITSKYDSNGNIKWNKTLPGSGIYDVAIDSLGNIYGIGRISNYVVKYDPNGNVIFNGITGSSISEGGGAGIALDSLNNIIITSHNSNYDLVVEKRNSSGVKIWNRTYSGAGYDHGYSVNVDNSNNIYVTGYTRAIFGGNSDVILLKYDSNGILQWSKTFGGTKDESGYSVDTDSNGNVYVTGRTRSFTNSIASGIVLKYDTNGNLVFNRTFSPVNDSRGNSIAVKDNRLYVTGTGYSYITYEDDLLFYVYDTNGNLLKEHKLSGYRYETGEGIDTYNNDIVIVGHSDSSSSAYDNWIIKLNHYLNNTN